MGVVTFTHTQHLLTAATGAGGIGAGCCAGCGRAGAAGGTRRLASHLRGYYQLPAGLQYVLSSIWVFPYAPRNAVIGFTAFSLLSLVGLAITWGTMWLLYDNLGIFYLFAKGVALLFAFCWNFLSRRYWLFRPPKEDSSQQQ
jgi:hypothetical protein